MMTLEEAIKRYTSNAFYEKSDGNLQGYLEFNQLAEWLKDYKRLLEQKPKTGHWIKHDTGHSIYYDCSLCSCIAPYTETADNTLWIMTKYCPDCGTKMESEIQNADSN